MAGCKQRAKYVVSFTLIFSTENGVANRYLKMDKKSKWRVEHQFTRPCSRCCSVLVHSRFHCTILGCNRTHFVSRFFEWWISLFWEKMLYHIRAEHLSVVKIIRTLQLVVFSWTWHWSSWTLQTKGMGTILVPFPLERNYWNCTTHFADTEPISTPPHCHPTPTPQHEQNWG